MFSCVPATGNGWPSRVSWSSVKPERRSEAPVALDRADQAVAAVAHALAAVADVEARPPRIRQREAELQLAARRVRLADVANDEPRPLIVEGNRARDVRLADSRIGVAEAEVADVLSELPLQRSALALAEQVRLVEAEESAEAGALPTDAPKLTLPVRFSFT